MLTPTGAHARHSTPDDHALQMSALAVPRCRTNQPYKLPAHDALRRHAHAALEAAVRLCAVHLERTALDVQDRVVRVLGVLRRLVEDHFDANDTRCLAKVELREDVGIERSVALRGELVMR